MVEGFWILKVERPEFTTGGVVIFLNGKFFGGDNGFAWIGTYEEADGVIKARVAVSHFDPSIESVLGIAGDYEMHFSGKLKGDVITGTGMVANHPQKSIGIRLTKKANL
jgi:T3SS negative regulator,GrlR